MPLPWDVMADNHFFLVVVAVDDKQEPSVDKGGTAVFPFLSASNAVADNIASVDFPAGSFAVFVKETRKR